MTRSINDLGETLLTQLNEIVTGGDDTAPKSPNSFVSWCQPGIPFEPSDFDFAVKGIGGGADAEEDKLLLQQAFNFSQVVDFIPDASGLYKDDQQQAIFRTSEARLSHMYEEILRLSRVVKTELTAEEKAKIDKFRNLLWETKTVKNIVTDEETEVTVPGKVTNAYNAGMSKYIDEALVYNSARIAAQGATGPEGKAAVANWTNNAQLFRLKVKAAKDAWVAGGFRNEVDQMNAYINQTTQRDMVMWKQRLLEYYEGSMQDALGAGQRFFFSSPIPGNFAHSKGWTNYSVYHNETSSSTSSSRKSWKAGGRMPFSIFSGSASGETTKTKRTAEFSVSDFRMEFELAQVLISRPGMYPEFFMNRGWNLDKGHGWHFDKMPSDGAEPPDGMFVGYSTSILFARNIKIKSAEFESEYEKFTKEVKASASVGWGPFKLKGSHGSNEESTFFETTRDGAGLSVPGMQIIGFINHKIGKAPNPAEGLKDSDFE